MKYFSLFLTFIFVLAFVSCNNQKTYSESGQIKINSLGYKPASVKRATILNYSGSFTVNNAKTNKVVFSGITTDTVYQADVAQTASIADFTTLNQNGTYYIKLQNGWQSVRFNINTNVYNHAFYHTFRGFYLWRCGTNIEAVFGADTFRQNACHLTPGELKYSGLGNGQKDGNGGWHDAGDYGKYVVNAAVTVGQMFMAWDNFNQKLDTLNLNLPETAIGYPDYLKEIKWETDWLLKMQYPDSSGRVFHKLTTLYFPGFVMPDIDTATLYFTTWGSTATACFAGIMAQAARYFKPYDTAYANICLNAALRSYNYLDKNPQYVPWGQPEFNTGGYKCHDADPRLWAAAEMWKTTGELKYLESFEKQAMQFDQPVDVYWDWGNIKNMGIIQYLTTPSEHKNAHIVEHLLKHFLAVADSLVNVSQTDIYARPITRYDWGCNGTVARVSQNLYTAWLLTGNQNYYQAAQQIIDHLFGRNFYGRSYVTQIGINPPLYPHDRRCSDSIVAPWPGYLVGGGHTATNWIDQEASYATNEIAINWNAALVYALAMVIE